ncbi:hypothetical protein JCGZ_12029 [Jatropha curcas]|uniref:Uncharacterized protein n=1 Tax=Jatropha curcas TaxID=180498 RepID=A0A067K9I0_JATCU|nr:uncharacterized protein LOC105638872 [Jatropha curcas]KDP32737.1 hypothetical protein JCGZ_12029 [Jatropha curcas]
MGNGYNHHQNFQLYHKSTFLPMLCSRPSIKDVCVPNKLEDRSMSFSSEPLSPKIGCMGQVKKHNKIIGFPTSSSSSSSSNKITFTTRNDIPSVKYFKLKRIFSGKNNFTSTISTTSCRRRGLTLDGAKGMPKIEDSKENSVSINIAEMDPPLPVIKKVHKPNGAGEEETLWKRRSGGVPLKNLQLKQIQLNRQNFAPTTV